MRPSLGSSTACAMPGTIERGHLPRGPHPHHPTARMPERRSASRLQEVPDPRAGIDAGGTRGAGVTGAGPLRAVSLGAAGGGRPLRPRSHHCRRPLRRPRCRAACARHGRSLRGCADRGNAVLANALGVGGTPPFVIGDGMIRRALPLEQFRAAIAGANRAQGARNRSGPTNAGSASSGPCRGRRRGASSVATTVPARHDAPAPAPDSRRCRSTSSEHWRCRRSMRPSLGSSRCSATSHLKGQRHRR